jgi:hypothetical protein
MKKVLHSKGFKIFALIAIVYTFATFFITNDFQCVTTDQSGGCGIQSGLLNLPAIIITSPLLFLFGETNADTVWSVPVAILFCLVVTLGWLILGAVVGWIISKIRSKKNPVTSQV